MAAPATPVLDTFNRADESPITGWTTWYGTGMKVDTNRMTGAAASYQGAYLTPVYSGGNVEVFVQLDNTAPWTDELYYFSSTDQLNCYRLLLHFPAANQFQVQRRIAGAGVMMGAVTAWTFATGDWFGVTLLNGVHEVYAKTSAGAWTLKDTFVDSTHTSGVLGYLTAGGAGGAYVGDFGGGQAVPVTDEAPLRVGRSPLIWRT